MSDLNARLNAMNRINAVLETLDRPDTVVVLHALMEQYRVYYEPPHYLKGRHAVKTIAAALGLMLLAGFSQAEAQVSVKQSTCTYTATVPQTNADGTNLTDLKEFRIYYATTLAGLTPTLAPFVKIPASAPDPAAGAILAWPCKTLPTGPGVITSTAVDLGDNEGARASVVPFSLQDDVPPGVLTAPAMAGP